VNDEVVDLRLEQAIHFRKNSAQKNQKTSALFTVLTGDKKNHTFEVRFAHCIVLCRSPLVDFDSDTTFVGKINDKVSQTRIPVDPKTMGLIDKTLRLASQDLGVHPDFDQSEAWFGGFMRDVDFLVEDEKVAKTHAVIFRNREGVFILDLFSPQGTFINGKEIEQHMLKNNDVISVGTLSLRVNFL